MGASGGVAKVLQKLQRNIEAGSFYEAHEMFKTVYHRNRARRQLEESYQLAEEGAKLQLEKGQLNCGVELALLLVEAYEADNVEPNEASVQRVLGVLAAFPRAQQGEGYEPPVEEATKVASVAVKWLRRGGGEEFVGRVELVLAQYIRAVLGWQGLGAALPHYAQAGGDMQPLAEAVAEAVAQGLPHEEDLFLARCTLQTATAGPSSQAAQQLEAAGRLLEAYEAVTGRLLPDTPLMHFVQLYLEALRRRSEPLSQLLLQRYKGSLDRDPTLWAPVMKAQAAHMPSAPAGGMGGLFGDLFKTMFAPPPPPPPAPTPTARLGLT